MKRTTFALAAALTLLAGTAARAEDMKMTPAEPGAMPGMAMMETDFVTPDAMKMEHGQKLGDLVVYDFWTRAMPPAARAGGGFVTIVNTGSTDDRLVSASSPAAAFVQLHTMTMKDGVMVMREMESGIDIPAGKAVALKPGGLHIMFIDAEKPFVEGETVPVTLNFEKSGTITLELPVAALGAKDMPMAH